MCDIFNYALFDNNYKEVKYLAVSNIIQETFVDKEKMKSNLFDHLQVKESFNPRDRFLTVFKHKLLE